MSSIRAHFDGQHFVPDEPVTGLVAGDNVQIVLLSTPRENDAAPLEAEQAAGKNGAPASKSPASCPPGSSALRWLAENSVDDESLPADLGYQHDHYLYGTPKKPE